MWVSVLCINVWMVTLVCGNFTFTYDSMYFYTVKYVCLYIGYIEAILCCKIFVFASILNIFFSIFTLNPAYSWVYTENLVLRHFVPHFPPNFRGIACLLAKLNAALLGAACSNINCYVDKF